MRDGQHFDYIFSIDMDELACPKCHSNERLVFKGDSPMEVSPGYVGVCLNCEEDFYLTELVQS